MKRPSPFLNILLWLGGMGLCVLPPLICTLLYFPVWARAGGEYIISGITLTLGILAVIPLYKEITKLLSSTAAYTVWLILFAVFFALDRIAGEMVVISFIGFVGNVLGAIVLRVRENLETGRDEE